MVQKQATVFSNHWTNFESTWSWEKFFACIDFNWVQNKYFGSVLVVDLLTQNSTSHCGSTIYQNTATTCFANALTWMASLSRFQIFSTYFSSIVMGNALILILPSFFAIPPPERVQMLNCEPAPAGRLKGKRFSPEFRFLFWVLLTSMLRNVHLSSFWTWHIC